jgi:hypothetical protein
MLFAALGKLDFLTVLILLAAAIVPKKFLMAAAVYLLIKGAIFVWMNRDFASYGDFFSGIYLVILANGLRIPYLHNVVLFWLIQKTALTFIAIGLKLVLFYYEYKDELPFR